MKFFGNIADTFGLNFKRSAYRRKLKELAKDMIYFCKFRPIIHDDTRKIENSCENIYDYIKTYAKLTSELYNLLFELCKKKDKSSSSEKINIWEKLPDTFFLDMDNYAKYFENEFTTYFGFFKLNGNNLIDDLNKIQEWLKSLDDLKNGFYNIWTSNIKKAVKDLSKISLSKILTDNISVLKRSNSLIIKNNKLKINKVKTSDKLQRSQTSNYEVKIDELISRIDEFLNKRKNQSYKVSDVGKKAIFNDIFEYHFIVKDLYTLLKQSKNPTLKSKFSDIEKSFDFGRNLSFMDTMSSCLNFKEQENKHIQEPIGKFLQKNNNYKTMEEALEEYRSWLENVADINLNNSSAWPDKLRLRVQKLSETMMGLELTAALQGKRAWVPIKDRKGYKFSS